MGVKLDDVFRTLQANLGSVYVNDFNKFDRTYQVRVQADASVPRRPGRDQPAGGARPRGHGHAGRRAGCRARGCRSGTLLDDRDRSSGRSRSSATTCTRPRRSTGAAAPGVSSGEALKAMEEVAEHDAAADDGLRVDRHRLPGEAASAARRSSGVRAGRAAGVPRARGAVRELAAAVRGDPGRAAGPARRGRGGEPAHACCTDADPVDRRRWTTTSTRRSAWC